MNHVGLPPWLQYAWALAGVGVAAGGLIWILLIFWPYLRWSRQMMIESFKLGQQTAKILADVQKKIDPMIEDANAILKETRDVLGKLRTQDLGKVEKILKDLAEDGKLDRFVAAIEKIGDRLQTSVGKPTTNLDMEAELQRLQREPHDPIRHLDSRA